MQIRFRYLIEDRDRHGNIRIYVRVPGRRKVRIRAPFGTDKFVAALQRGHFGTRLRPAAGRCGQAGIVPACLRALLRQRHVQAARSGDTIMAAPGA